MNENKIIYDDYEITYANNDVKVKCLTTGKIYCSKFKTFKIIKQLQQENARLKDRNKKAMEFLKEFHNYENRFKWCEEDYIDTIEKLEEILKGEQNEQN